MAINKVGIKKGDELAEAESYLASYFDKLAKRWDNIGIQINYEGRFKVNTFQWVGGSKDILWHNKF